MINEILNLSLLKEKYAEITESFSFYYPIKANDNPQVIQALNSLGSGFLVANYDKALSLIDNHGVSATNLLYITSATCDKEIDKLVDRGIKFFVVDSYNKINILSKKGVRVNVLLRVSVPIQELDRFGVELDKINDYINAIESGNMNFVGLHFHIPSKYNTLATSKLVIKRIIDQYPDLACLDIGGGNSFEDLKELAKYIDEISNVKQKICEIGYGFINDVIAIVAEVIDVKCVNGINIASIDVGIYSGLMDVFLCQRVFPIIFPHGVGEKTLYRIYGPSLDHQDFIGEYCLPILHVGDKLLIKDSGAYVRTLLTTF